MAHPPERNRRAGELADGMSDLIESYLGPVRTAAEIAAEHVRGPFPPGVWTRDLLLVTDGWATVLHLRVDD